MTRPDTRFVALPIVGGDESKTKSSCPVKIAGRRDGTGRPAPGLPRRVERVSASSLESGHELHYSM